jgi:galactokinase/mevalonate kinase-like predicted kinase
MNEPAVERLLSLPAGVTAKFGEIEPYRSKNVFAASDPPDMQLGSGGGTAHLLVEAWRNDGKNDNSSAMSFPSWIAHSRKLLVHGSGETRRLPAYAAIGKPLIPIPPLYGLSCQRQNQALLDLQLHTYERLLWYAPSTYRVMITCGDVMLRFDSWLPRYPDADVLIFGMAAPPDEARRHGVMLCESNGASPLARFVQKPGLEELREFEEKYTCYLDTGVWLLGEKALTVLMEKCGWDAKKQDFQDKTAGNYDLFAAFGPALGTTPVKRISGISELSCAVVPLPDARFYHFGTNASLLASVTELQHPAAERRSFGHASIEKQSSPVILNADVHCPVRPEHRHIWIENSDISAGWVLAERHILTGIPKNNWNLSLEPGVCLDIAPVGDNDVCIRPYGFEDPFRGRIGDKATMWLNQPAPEWFSRRGIALDETGIPPQTDIFDAPIFPVMKLKNIDPHFLAWLFTSQPADCEYKRLWLSLPRLSGRQLLNRSDVAQLNRQRSEHKRKAASSTTETAWLDSCAYLDLASAAEVYAANSWNVPELSADGKKSEDLALVHDSMFRYAVGSRKGEPDAKKHEAEAFDRLHRLIVGQMELKPVKPARNVLEDQIVWGRSPVRLDLAGGWTDTPPYCLEHGGCVVNVAVDINGQPPIQVFGRLSDKPEIVIRSIDLGIDERVKTYDELRQWNQLGSGFGIAKAALALAGLEPRFHAKGNFQSLEQQLKKEFGGGIELSMICAIPKGSGLGTSSILAATLLGALSELCGLQWDTGDIFTRTLAIEQMLTSGGGWQDQAGGVLGGIKLIQTMPGLVQTPVARWLPGGFFSDEHVNKTVLLYYTGLTRVAHDILGEIVRGMFLNSAAHLNIIEEIGYNALFAADAIQRNDWAGLCEAVRRSWQLNQRLDGGTNPPQVQTILDRVKDHVAAAKLLGAGGGGYMLILAKNAEAGSEIKRLLAENPPNNRARFVNLSLSETGFQVTRS